MAARECVGGERDVGNAHLFVSRGLCSCHHQNRNLEGSRPQAVIVTAVAVKARINKAVRGSGPEFPLEHFFSGNSLKCAWSGPSSVPQRGVLPRFFSGGCSVET